MMLFAEQQVLHKGAVGGPKHAEDECILQVHRQKNTQQKH